MGQEPPTRGRNSFCSAFSRWSSSCYPNALARGSSRPPEAVPTLLPSSFLPSFLLLLPPIHSLIYPPIIHPPIFLSIFLKSVLCATYWADCWEGKVENNIVFPLRISQSWRMTSPFLNHFYCWKVLFSLAWLESSSFLSFSPIGPTFLIISCRAN